MTFWNLCGASPAAGAALKAPTAAFPGADLSRGINAVGEGVVWGDSSGREVEPTNKWRWEEKLESGHAGGGRH